MPGELENSPVVIVFTTTTSVMDARGTRLILSTSDADRGVFESVGLGDEFDFAGLAFFCSNNDQGKAVKRGTLRFPESFQIGGVAVVGGHNLAGALNLEAYPVLCARHSQTFLVCHRDGHERQILAIGADLVAVRLQLNAGSRSCRLHPRHCPFLAVSVSDDLQFARLINDVVPAEAIFVLALLLSTKRFAVEEQLALIS